MQQEETSSCDAEGEPCFAVGEPHVMLGFLKKSPHKNTGALCGELGRCHSSQHCHCLGNTTLGAGALCS